MSYIKYNETDMKYLYMCRYCGQSGKITNKFEQFKIILLLIYIMSSSEPSIKEQILENVEDINIFN